jgi:hypothetical protein
VDDRLTFVSTREDPLLVIFYDGPDRSLTPQAIRSGRHRNEYWNAITPYAFILGAFSQIVLAAGYLSRPAFRMTVITAFIAIFTPLFPLIPPGILFGILYRRLWWQARIFRAYRDLVRLPLIYLSPPGRLPDGQRYGAIVFEGTSDELRERQIPLLIPETMAGQKRRWYIVGVLPAETRGNFPGSPDSAELPRQLPGEPRDPFATFGAIQGNPEVLARGYTKRAYILEVLAWMALLAGIGLNIFFISMIIILLG